MFSRAVLAVGDHLSPAVQVLDDAGHHYHHYHHHYHLDDAGHVGLTDLLIALTLRLTTHRLLGGVHLTLSGLLTVQVIV